ncbi:MAG: S9 family peptidase [Tissierellia bacterium]|nr:S9 family peptidase [Tissierellia bacterium]
MEKLKLDDFTKYKFLSGLKFSPNGSKLAFILHEMDVEENKYLSNIHIYDLENKAFTKLTSSNTAKSFVFKDENTLLFPDMRDKKDKERKEKGEDFTLYYEISLRGGEASKAFEIPLIVSKLELIDEDRYLLLAEYNHRKPNLEGLSQEEKQKTLKEFEEEKDYIVIDEIPYWANGAGFTNKTRRRAYIYNIKDKKLKAITDVFTNVDFIKLNRDKTKLLLITNSFTDKMQLKEDLYLYDIEKDTLEKISHLDHFSYGFADFVGDSIIFTGTDMAQYGVNENPKIYLMDQNRRVKELLPVDFDLSLWNSVGTDCRFGASNQIKLDGDYLYFITTEYGNAHLNRIDMEGNTEKLTRVKGSVDGFDVHDGKIIFIGFRDLKLQELYELNDGEEVQLSNFNEWVLKERKLSQPERLTFTTKEGISIEGWVMKPVDFEEGKKYPAILNIHGGPKTVYGEIFFHEMQYWANEGYVVFFCNPRGSDGRGNEFADIRGKYGTIDYEDIMNFTDLVLEKYPFIDGERVGVTGGSYGGFMTNWIIGHTNRFKAAVSQRSISNWISNFGTTDIGYFFVEDQQSATPWTDAEKLWWHSPMKYADKVQTPTLFIHSDEDFRCWIVEAYQMFTSLKYNGVEARLVIFKGENHDLSRSGRPKQRIRRLKEITQWFDKYLKIED